MAMSGGGVTAGRVHCASPGLGAVLRLRPLGRPVLAQRAEGPLFNTPADICSLNTPPDTIVRASLRTSDRRGASSEWRPLPVNAMVSLYPTIES